MRSTKHPVDRAKTDVPYTDGNRSPLTRLNSPALIDFIREIPNLPIYRFGLVLFALLLIVPAIVSGNMVQHLATRIVSKKLSLSQGIKPLAGNFLIFIASVGIICYAIYVYLVQ